MDKRRRHFLTAVAGTTLSLSISGCINFSDDGDDTYDNDEPSESENNLQNIDLNGKSGDVPLFTRWIPSEIASDGFLDLSMTHVDLTLESVRNEDIGYDDPMYEYGFGRGIGTYKRFVSKVSNNWVIELIDVVNRDHDNLIGAADIILKVNGIHVLIGNYLQDEIGNKIIEEGIFGYDDYSNSGSIREFDIYISESQNIKVAVGERGIIIDEENESDIIQKIIDSRTTEENTIDEIDEFRWIFSELPYRYSMSVLYNESRINDNLGDTITDEFEPIIFAGSGRIDLKDENKILSKIVTRSYDQLDETSEDDILQDIANQADNTQYNIDHKRNISISGSYDK